jgi:hypothetical protein
MLTVEPEPSPVCLRVRAKNWLPDRDLGLSLREFLPSIKIGPSEDTFSPEMLICEPFVVFFQCRNTQTKAKKWKEKHARA